MIRIATDITASLAPIADQGAPPRLGEPLRALPRDAGPLPEVPPVAVATH
jgi:hypothetical protein